MKVQTVLNFLHLPLNRCACTLASQGGKVFTNFLKYLERPIPYWLQLLTFTLHSVFPNVQLDLITNLEAMLNSMLIMPCLVLGLTSFQLFLHCLVNFLDLFNELGCFVHIIMSINCYVFNKYKIQGRLWYKTKTSLKRRSLSRRVLGMVVSMLHITQILIPKLGILAAIASEQLDHCLVDHFYLTIYLWMKCCAFLQSGVH